MPVRIHSMVGLVPLFAVFAASPQQDRGPHDFRERTEWFVEHRPDLLKNVAPVLEPGVAGTQLLGDPLHGTTHGRVATDARPRASFSPTTASAPCRGIIRSIRSNSRSMARNSSSKYLPAESDSRLFGGNSNWRGPIWFPVNYLIVRSLHEFSLYYGDDLRVECPTGSGQMLTLDEVAREIARRLSNIFLRDEQWPAGCVRRQ